MYSMSTPCLDGRSGAWSRPPRLSHLSLSGSATEGMARQPENTARIQTAMIIAAALIEGVALFVAVIAFLIQGKITF